MQSTSPPRPIPTARRWGVVLLLGAALLVASVPAPIETSDVTGGDIALTPSIVRAPMPTATVRLDVGTAVAGDVVVRWHLATPSVSPTGSVSVSETSPVAARILTTGGRVRPGEATAVTISLDDDAAPFLVVADVTPATSPTTTGDGASMRLVTLVLPGDPPSAPPTLRLAPVGSDLGVAVTVDAATVVSLRVAAHDVTTFEERLVLPGTPLRVTVAPAAWPRPATAAVTDELGRVTRAQIGEVPTLVAAGLLLAGTLVALVITVRRRRADGRRQADSS